MSIITDTLPQQLEPITITLLKDVIQILPETLDYPINVWIGGKLARYGQTSENVVFLLEGTGEASTEMKQYFNSIAKQFQATASNRLFEQGVGSIRIYNEGRLIIDKETLCFTELPSPTLTPPILKLEDVLSLLPKTIKFKHTIYLTGSLVRFGWSGNDVDFIVDSEDTEVYKELRQFFKEIIGWKVDVGNADMPERAPVYKCRIYEGGIWQL